MSVNWGVFMAVLLAFGDRDSAMARSSGSGTGMTLDMVRDWLIREEDSIVFCLIERAKFPLNAPAYDESQASIPGFCGSVAEFVVKETEQIQAKAGRYRNPEEHPFFPDGLAPSLVTPAHEFSSILHPVADSINLNAKIWDMYIKQLIPLLAKPGDDENYAATALSDLNCLQAMSRRIHLGNFVAEVKFRDAPQDYEPAIRSQDRDALMNLLTFKAVEEAVKKRVEKKAATFAQDVSLNTTDGKYKIDPPLVSRLYDEWIMPLTKEVEVEYLLRRLD